MSLAVEAKAHEAQAEKSLKPSWMALKFNPDRVVASMEFSQAATKYRGAGMLAEAVRCHVRSAEEKALTHDQFGAGRAYESAGGICESAPAAGGTAAAAEHWMQAKQCFRLAGKAEIAAKLILKLAALHDKAGKAKEAKECYEEAIEVFKDDEKDFNLGDVYKQYIGFLVRQQLFEDALKAIDGHIEVLLRQKHLPFVHKELLSKVVLLLHMGDTVRAEDAVARMDVSGWCASTECQAGSDLVEGFKAHDPEAVQKALKEQVFTFIQVEVARLARSLRVEGAAAAGGGGGYGGTAEAMPPTKADLADMLM